jgi:hypothetical protein
MNSRTDKIYAALNQFCDALDLRRSESSTERLFLVLATAFNQNNVTQMESVLEESHEESLCYDMRGPIADTIQEALASYVTPCDANFNLSRL